MRFLAGLLLFLPAGWGQSCTLPALLRSTDSVPGVLTDLQCRFSDGTPYVEYSITFPTHGEVELSVESKDPDLRLLFRNPAGRKVDAGLSMRRRVERGTHSVLVTAPKPGEGDPFTLTAAFRPEPNTLCREFPAAGPGQTLNGRLDAGSCRLPDQTAYDGYSVAVLGPGTVEIVMEATGFDPYVTLRTSEGRAVAEGGLEEGAKSVKLTAAVRGPEVYTLTAAALEAGKTGAYQAAMKFVPDPDDPCRMQKALTKSESIDAKLAATNACVAPPSALFHYYDLNVDAAGQAEVTLTSAAFATFVSLVDASGRSVASDAVAGGPRRSVLRRQLAPGKYQILAFSPDGDTGDYTLKYDFRPGPPDTCPLLTLAAGQARNGSLTAASCRNEDGLADFYRVELAEPGTFVMEMTTPDFGSALTLRDERDNRIAEDYRDIDVVNGTRVSRSRLAADLPAGAYTVSAGTTGYPGSYSLGLRTSAKTLSPCAKVQKLTVNSAYIGQLDLDSCRGADGQPVDYYEFTAPSDAMVAAVMTSRDFDGHLTLEDGKGIPLRSDDSSFGSGDALIVQFLPGATYRLAARSAQPLTGGLYRIDVLAIEGNRAAGCTPVGAVKPGEPAAGQLRFTSCQWRDDTFADLHRLDVAAAADFVIGLKSTQFDAEVLLLDAHGAVLDRNDDSGGNTDALLRVKLQPGAYYVVAKAAADYVTGAYTLDVRIQ